MMTFESENFAIININSVDSRCGIWNMTRKYVINRLNNSKLGHFEDEPWYK